MEGAVRSLLPLLGSQVQEMIEAKKGMATSMAPPSLSQMPHSLGMASQPKFSLPYSHSQPAYSNQVSGVCVCVCACACVHALIVCSTTNKTGKAKGCTNFWLVMFFVSPFLDSNSW